MINIPAKPAAADPVWFCLLVSIPGTVLMIKRCGSYIGTFVSQIVLPDSTFHSSLPSICISSFTVALKERLLQLEHSQSSCQASWHSIPFWQRSCSHLDSASFPYWQHCFPRSGSASFPDLTALPSPIGLCFFARLNSTFTYCWVAHSYWTVCIQILRSHSTRLLLNVLLSRALPWSSCITIWCCFLPPIYVNIHPGDGASSHPKSFVAKLG